MFTTNAVAAGIAVGEPLRPAPRLPHLLGRSPGDYPRPRPRGGPDPVRKVRESQRRRVREVQAGCMGEGPEAPGDLRTGPHAGGVHGVRPAEAGAPEDLEDDDPLVDRGPAVRPLEGRRLPRGSPRRV